MAFDTLKALMPWGRKQGDYPVTKAERWEILRDYDKKEYKYIERILGVPIWKFTDYESFQQAGSKKVWAAFRACHIVASTITATDYSVVTKKNQTITPLENLQSISPDLFRILEEPNPFDSWEEVSYQWAYHMKLPGNAYWLKDEIDLKGRPTNVFPLLPQFMKIIPDAKMRVSKYIYWVNGRQLIFDPEEIIHFRRPHPRDNIMGMGDIEPSQDLFTDFINQQIYDERFMENGAMPSGVLIKEDEVDDESQWEKLKAYWREQYGGKRNSGKTAMLQGKWNYTQLGLNAQQMQQIEKRKFSLEQIFMAMGVPLSVAGWSNAANYATARLDDINMRKYEIKPLIDIFVGKINRRDGLIRPFNDNWRLHYNLGGLIDVEQVWNDYGPAMQNGVLSPNEVREKMGMTKSEDPLMDQHYISRNLVPLEQAGQADPGTADISDMMSGVNRRAARRESQKAKQLDETKVQQMIQSSLSQYQLADRKKPNGR